MYCPQLLVLNQQKWRLNGKERLLALIGVTEAVLSGTTSSKDDESESWCAATGGLSVSALTLLSLW